MNERMNGWVNRVDKKAQIIEDTCKLGELEMYEKINWSFPDIP
jgi:hypothetical protein